MGQDHLSVTRRLTIWGLAGLGAALMLWLGYSVLQNSPGFCPGAPAAYGQLRTVAAQQRSAAFRRLTLPERIAVYQADQRCSRPSDLSLGTVTDDRDSTVVRDLFTALGGLPTAADTSVVVQLLAYAKCERGFTVVIDSGSLARLTVTIAGMPEGLSLSRGVAALNRVAGECRLSARPVR